MPRKFIIRPAKHKPPREAVKPAFSVEFRKAAFMLDAFSPGELQAKIKQTIPHKAGRKPDSPIVKREKFIPGSRIPASTIARFQSGEYRLREKSTTAKKLAKLYDEYQLSNLRAHGANKEDARRYHRRPPETLKKILENYYYNARVIQYNYEKHQNIKKPLHYIMWGMAHSRHFFSDWDKLAMISGISKKPPRKPRRKGYGSHRE